MRLKLKSGCAAAILVLGAVLAGPSRAGTQFISYDNATGLPQQNWSGSLGLDFDVNYSMTITALGAFDNGFLANLNGVDGTSGVTVGIYDITTNTWATPLVNFTAGSSVTQLNGDAFLALVTAVTLGVGQYSIVTFNDMNFNTSGAQNHYSTLNTGFGAISFVGSGRYDSWASGDPYTLPSIPDGGPDNRYDAGTFEFLVPEPLSAALLVVGMTAVGVAARRRHRAA
jgi:hypothetical protein